MELKSFVDELSEFQQSLSTLTRYEKHMKLGRLPFPYEAKVKLLLEKLAVSKNRLQRMERTVLEGLDHSKTIDKIRVENLQQTLYDLMNQYSERCLDVRLWNFKSLPSSSLIAHDMSGQTSYNTMQTSSQTQELEDDMVDSEFMSWIIESRDQEVAEIERDVHLVQDIFQNLAGHVTSQGEIMGNVVLNIESADVSNEDAVRQLRRTNNTQKRKRTCQCYIVIFIVITILVLALIIRFT